WGRNATLSSKTAEAFRELFRHSQFLSQGLNFPYRIVFPAFCGSRSVASTIRGKWSTAAHSPLRCACQTTWPWSIVATSEGERSRWKSKYFVSADSFWRPRLRRYVAGAHLVEKMSATS